MITPKEVDARFDFSLSMCRTTDHINELILEMKGFYSDDVIEEKTAEVKLAIIDYVNKKRSHRSFNRSGANKDLPRGVYRARTEGKFVGVYRNLGKQKQIGIFETKELAFNAVTAYMNKHGFKYET